jgi:hypothetical protein
MKFGAKMYFFKNIGIGHPIAKKIRDKNENLKKISKQPTYINYSCFSL